MLFIKTLGVLLLCHSSMSFSATFTEAQRIYESLGGHLPLKLMEYEYEGPNAKYHGSYISINSSMLKFVRNNNELAFVLSHEIAHSVLPYDRAKYWNELKADRYARTIMNRVGYNFCSGTQILKRFSWHDDGKHPNGAYRLQALGC